MYHPDSEKDIIVLKEVVGEPGDISRRFIILDNEVVVQYWSRVELQWYDLSPAVRSARTVDLFDEIIIEQHNEITRLKKLVEDTAKAGEELINVIELRQHHFLFETLEEKFQNTNEYRRGYNEALQGLTKIGQ